MCNQASALHCCMHNSNSTSPFPAYLSLSEKLSWNLKLATSSRKTLKTIFQTLQYVPVPHEKTRALTSTERLWCIRASHVCNTRFSFRDSKGHLGWQHLCWLHRLRKWHPHALWLILGYPFHSRVITHNLKHMFILPFTSGPRNYPAATGNCLSLISKSPCAWRPRLCYLNQMAGEVHMSCWFNPNKSFGDILALHIRHKQDHT